MEKIKVLVIDDEENFTRLVKLNLEKTGKYEVKVENKGSQGLISARTFRPDLILLDIVMPDIDGGEVARQIKKDTMVKDIPIVFLTAIATKEETTPSGAIIGGHPFIAKSVTTEELINCIEKNTRY